MCGCPNITALHKRSLSDYVEHERSARTAITRTSPDASSYFLLLPESRAYTARVSTRVNISVAGGGGASRKQRKAAAHHMAHLGALHYRTMAAFDVRRRRRHLRMLHRRDDSSWMLAFPVGVGEECLKAKLCPRCEFFYHPLEPHILLRFGPPPHTPNADRFIGSWSVRSRQTG